MNTRQLLLSTALVAWAASWAAESARASLARQASDIALAPVEVGMNVDGQSASKAPIAAVRGQQVTRVPTSEAHVCFTGRSHALVRQPSTARATS